MFRIDIGDNEEGDEEEDDDAQTLEEVTSGYTIDADAPALDKKLVHGATYCIPFRRLWLARWSRQATLQTQSWSRQEEGLQL